MIDYKRASYLSERKYTGDTAKAEENQELLQYWKEVLGGKHLDFLKKKYEDTLAGFFKENQYKYKEWQKEGMFQKIEKLYKSHSYGIRNVWKYINRDEVIFPDFYEPYLELSIEWVYRRGNSVQWSEGMIKGLLRALIERLQSVSLRTLILEMYICRQEGKLQGENSACEYEYYQKNFINKEAYRDELEEYYPVMFRSMLEIIEMSAELYVAMIQRFYNDLNEINHAFYPDHPAGKIQSIDGKMADTHRNGQSVQKLLLDNGEVLIYKPHSVNNEVIYMQMMQWIYQKCKTDCPDYRIIGKEDYGWCQFVEYKTCTKRKELEDYYRKLGMNLFTAYFLGTGDLHCENLIANGSNPVIVDVETLTKMPVKSEITGVNGRIRQELERSVLYLGLLPFYSWDRNGNGINISAVSGMAGQVAQIKVPRIVNPKTSDMHVEYQNPTMEGSSNLAMLNGEFVEPQAFSKELEEGFEKAFMAVMEEKEGFYEKVKLVRESQSRYLIRDTQQYVMALISSYHPDFLSDGAERELSLYSLYEGKTEEKMQHLIVESEVEELLKGDIPYFYYEADEPSLIGGSGRRIQGYFQTSVMEYLEERLQKLDQKELETQKKYIRMSMNMMPERGQNLMNAFGSIQKSGADKKPSDKILIQTACTVGDWLLQNAVYNENQTEIGWTGVMLAGFREQEWHIQPVNFYMYGGIAGICLYFHALFKISKENRYASVLRIMDEMLFRYTDQVSEDTSKLLTHQTGAYEGEGSVAFVYQLLYVMTGEMKYLHYAEKHCQVVEKLLEEDPLYDLLQGNAGAAAIFLNMWNLTEKSRYLASAVKAGESLEKSKVVMEEGIGWPSEGATRPLLGMSHGSGGMQSVLFWLGSEAEEGDRFTRLAVQALQYEDSCYDSQKNNWSDYRDLEVTDEECYNIGPVAWCHGAAGILKARQESLRYAPAKVRGILKKDIQNAFDKTMRYAIRDGHCLCHGCCGNIDILSSVSDSCIGDSSIAWKAEKLCNTYAAQLAELMNQGGKGMLPQEREHPGMMTGMAGIGYFLLRIVDKSLPDILFPAIKIEQKNIEK